MNVILWPRTQLAIIIDRGRQFSDGQSFFDEVDMWPIKIWKPYNIGLKGNHFQAHDQRFCSFVYSFI